MDYITAQTPDKGVQIGKELPISNDSIAMTPDTVPGFGGNTVDISYENNVFKSVAKPMNADGSERVGAVVTTEFIYGNTK